MSTATLSDEASASPFTRVSDDARLPVSDTATKSGSATGGVRLEVIRMAWPVVVEQLLQTTVAIADVAITGRLGTTALAGSSVALQVFFVVLSGLMSVGIGTTVLVAQATGARSPERAASAVRQGVSIGVILGIVLTALGIVLAGPSVALGGASGEIAETADSYLVVSLLGMVPLTVAIAVSGAMRGAGDTRTPMVAGAIANVINIVAAWGLSFGSWGLPEMGILGAAWGGNIARIFSAVYLVAMLHRSSTPVGIRLGSGAPSGHSGWIPNLEVGKQFVTLSLPAVIEQLSFSLMFLVFGRILLSLGATVLGAQRIAFSAGSLAWLPSIGIMIAVTALVGQAIGARDLNRAAAVTQFGLQLAAGWMVLMGIFFATLGTPLAAAFTTDEATILEAGRGMLAFAPVMPIIGMGFVLGGALRGVGDTRFPMVTSIATGWLIILPVAWVCVFVLGWGFPGAVAGFGLSFVANFAALRWRFSKGDWQTPTVRVSGMPAFVGAE